MDEQELRLLKEERLRRLKQEKYRYYEPTGKGEQFINLVGSGKYVTSLFSAANGIGKSFLGVNMFAHLFWPCGSQWFQNPLWKKWPYPKRARICTEPSKLTGVDSVIENLKDQFPYDGFKCEKRGKNYEFHWTTDSGWEFDIMSYDQAAKEFEGPTLGLIWFDEPPPQSIYKACISRLRKGGLTFITATPLTGSAWMYDEIIANPDREEGYRSYLEADVESACIEHGIRGFLKHDDIERMVSQYDDEDKQARIKGKFQHLTGIIFKTFSRNIHVISPFQATHGEYAVYEFLDPHPRNPDAVGWYAVDRQGTKFVIDELWLKCTGGDKELAERIKSKASNYRIEGRFADPAAFIEDQHTESSLAMRLAGHGLHYQEATKAREQANRSITEALHYEVIRDPDGKAEQFRKMPELYFFDTCPRHLWEMEHYRWQEWVGRTAEDKNPKEKPVDKDDHMIEDLGRFLFMNPSFVENVQDQSLEGFSNQSFDPYYHEGDMQSIKSPYG